MPTVHDPSRTYRREHRADRARAAALRSRRQRHGHDAKACDDASATRTGAHAQHHTEALAAASFIYGPIATGLAHGYVKGKTATHASRQDGPRTVVDDGVRIPLPDPSGVGEFCLNDTGGSYTLLGHHLAPTIDHKLTDDKRTKSQLAAQTVAMNVGGTLKSQAISIAATLSKGSPYYYNRATLPKASNHTKLDEALHYGLCARGYDHVSVPKGLRFLRTEAGGLGVTADAATTGAALYDELLRCLGAPPRSPQALAVQAAWAQHAFMRGFEPSEHCRNALEYQPTTIDHRLALVYMVEAFWQITNSIGVRLRRSDADAKGALARDCAGHATPSRASSPFLRDFGGMHPYPTPRQTAAGNNKVIDLFVGADEAPGTSERTPRQLTEELAFRIYGDTVSGKGLQSTNKHDKAEMRALLQRASRSAEVQQALHALAQCRRHAPLDIRLAIWAHTPRANATYTVCAWRPRRPPHLPIFHIVTERDRAYDGEGAWLTVIQWEARLREIAAAAAQADAAALPAAASDTVFCQRQLATASAVLAHAQGSTSQPGSAVCELPPTLYEAALQWDPETWRLACERADDAPTRKARAATTRWYTEQWVPKMAYPYASELWRNRTTQFDWTVDRTHAPLNEISNYKGGQDGAGKQAMSAVASPDDIDKRRPCATRYTPETAHEIHRRRRAAIIGGAEPCPLTASGTAHLFACAHSPEASPFVYNADTLNDPLRRAFIRLTRLENRTGPALRVVDMYGNSTEARMQETERRELSESASRTAYTVFAQVAANLAGGAHMVRVGDGAHIPSATNPRVGISTAYAVFKGGWMTPQPRPNLRSASRPGPAPTDRTWLDQAQPAYGGCLGAGLTIASGEVAAMVACLREAIAIRRVEIERHRRLQTGGPIPEFNVLYGTDSKSCADEMEMHWESGTLLTIAKSKISPLAETYLHSRRELHDLNATFTLIKLPGHGGVYPMAAADACAKACHNLPVRPVELVVHSTLAIPVALPANPQTLATGADPHRWERLAGTPTPHAASSGHLQFAHARLQEAAAIEQLQRYIDSHDGAPYLAIDKAEAGLSPPEGCRRTRWVWPFLPCSTKAGGSTGRKTARPTRPRSPWR